MLGIDDRDAAEAKKNMLIEVEPRASDTPKALADDADALVGATAVDAENGQTLGVVAEIQDNGAQAILVIQTEGGERLVPCVEAFVAGSELDEAGGARVRIRVIAGLFDDEE